jgi:hypothetical protein
MKLYVKDVTREPNDTLYSFLYKVLKLNIKYERTEVNATYFDKELTNKQCNSGKHRSFDDIVLISKTYFKVSDKLVAKTLKKFLDDESLFLNFVLCDTAKKWVLYSGLSSTYVKYCANYQECYGKTDVKWEGVYSFEDILNLMNVPLEEFEIND